MASPGSTVIVKFLKLWLLANVKIYINVYGAKKCAYALLIIPRCTVRSD